MAAPAPAGTSGDPPAAPPKSDSTAVPGPPKTDSTAIPGSLAWWLARHTTRQDAQLPDGAGTALQDDPPDDPPAGNDGERAAGGHDDERHPLDLDRLAGAASQIVDSAGLDALTMRRLADTTGVGMAAIYRVVPSRQALLSELLDRVLGAVAEPEPGLCARTYMERWARAVRSALYDHPALAALLPRDQLAGPGAMRLREVALTALLRAGLAPADAAIVYWAVVDFTIGATVLDLSAAGDIDRADLYSQLPSDRFPSVVAAAEDARAQQGKAFELGLTALLAGAALRFPELDRTA